METAFKLLLAPAALGLAAIGYGASELALTYGCSAAPEPIALDALLEGGMDGNRYVSVTGHETGKTNLEISRKDRPMGSKVYVPVFVKGGDQSSALILEMSSLHANLFFDARKPIDGLVVSNSLPAEAQQKLADRYPGPDVGNSLILSVGKKPSSPEFGWGFVAVGVALMLPLCGLIFWVVLKERAASRRRSGLHERIPPDQPQPE